tara:strand:- start:422 stop:1030 length:609 start_codon:yes stop_codon:yes gene_type:complete
MKKFTEASILNFANTIIGKYSNKLQAQENPKEFAHINLYFQAINWSILQGPCLYSEQCYDYAPWEPYRQTIHKLYVKKKLLILENYQLKNPQRIAGAGLYPQLLKEINKEEIELKIGCSMEFNEIKPRHYIGKIESEKKCLISREGKITYLTSNVEVTNERWISEDKGYDKATHKQVWGTDRGPFLFDKVMSFNDSIKKAWG